MVNLLNYVTLINLHICLGSQNKIIKFIYIEVAVLVVTKFCSD